MAVVPEGSVEQNKPGRLLDGKSLGPEPIAKHFQQLREVRTELEQDRLAAACGIPKLGTVFWVHLPHGIFHRP